MRYILFYKFAEALRTRPERPLAFMAGAAGPLLLIGVLWAGSTGGLSGTVQDNRPQAFSIPVD